MYTNMKRLVLFSLLVLVLSGCASARAATVSPTATLPPAANQYAPQPGDDKLTGDTAEFVSAGVITAGSDAQLDISYRLPTPCHQTRVVFDQPDANKNIKVKVYSVYEANKPCALMALATPLQAVVDLGSLPKGHYTVYVNDVKAAEFDE